MSRNLRKCIRGCLWSGGTGSGRGTRILSTTSERATGAHSAAAVATGIEHGRRPQSHVATSSAGSTALETAQVIHTNGVRSRVGLEASIAACISTTRVESSGALVATVAASRSLSSLSGKCGLSLFRGQFMKACDQCSEVGNLHQRESLHGSWGP